MTIAALALGAYLRIIDVRLACAFEGLDFLLGGVVGPKGLHKIDTLLADGAHRLGAPVQVHFCHGWFVRALDATIQPVVSGLEGHLYKGVGRETHGCDEVLAIGLKIEALEFVLLNEVGEAGFGEAYGDFELGRHVPFELVRGGADVAKGVWVAFRRVRRGGCPECWGLAVDGAGETQDGVGIDVRGEAQDRVAVDASVLKVDTRGAIVADDYLKLVIPPVRAGANLDALFDLAGAAEHILAQRRDGGGLGVVEADDEEGSVDNTETIGVVGAFIAGEHVAQTGPYFTIFGAEDAEGALGGFLDGSLGGVVDDGLKVDGNVFLRHNEV